MTSFTSQISVRVIDNKAIVLRPHYNTANIRLHGSTVTCSVRADSDKGHDQITLYPEEDKDGLIAITVSQNKRDNKGREYHEYQISGFFKIIWKTGENGKHPFLNLQEIWTPGDRICHVDERGIEIVVKGRRCSSKKYHGYECGGKTIPLFVPDGDLLCRHLLGGAHNSDVLHAAVQEKLEPTRKKRIELLTNQLRREQWMNDMLRPMAEDSRRVYKLYQILAKSDLLLKVTAHAGARVCGRYLYAQDVIHVADELYSHLNKLPALFRRLPWISRFIRAMDEYKEKTKPTPVSA